MSETPQYHRLLLVRRGLCLLLGLLSLQLVNLQVLQHDSLSVQARRNTRHVTPKPATRGQIKDIRGNVLATCLPGKVVCADPSLTAGHELEVARALAPLLQTNETYLLSRLAPRTRMSDGHQVTNSYTVLKRRVPVDVWREVQTAMSQLRLQPPPRKMTNTDSNNFAIIRRKGVFAEDDQIRVYPKPVLAAHVVGYVDNQDVQAGMAGIESRFNTQLTGVAGWRETEVDYHHHEMVPYRDQDVEPEDGLNVVLTIDSGLQYIVESELVDALREHSPANISCTVVRPRTGEILAMATLPTYDPNTPNLFPQDSMRNRNITDLAEPGSTFKIVVVSAALNEGVVRLTDRIDCGNGKFTFAHHTLHDTHRHGMLTVSEIIAKSSNIGAAKIGLLLGPERLYKYILNYGFAESTRLPVPGENRTLVHRLTEKDRDRLPIVQIPMGQGIAVTPLHMVMAMSAMANGGRMMRPMLVSRLEKGDGRVMARFEPQTAGQVVSPEAAHDMVQALKTVMGPEGTAARMGLDNYTTAGKTGTAQKVMPGGKAYYQDKYFSSFIGFFPADRPELCISVVMDDPKGAHFGSQVAAPVFKKIAQRAASYLNIAPDLQPISRARGALAAAGPVGEGLPDTGSREE